MKKQFILPTPSIDWTKEDIVLITKSNIKHSLKNEEDLSPNAITTEQGYYSEKGYFLEQRNNYLSIVNYEVPCERVRDYNKGLYHIMYNDNNLCYACRTICKKEEWKNNRFELRIYQNGYAILLRQICINNHIIVYTVDDDTRDFFGLSFNWNESKRDDDFEGNEKILLKQIEECGTVIHSDDEAEKMSHQITPQMVKNYSYMFSSFTDDLRGHNLRNYEGYERHISCSNLSDETYKIIMKFFDPFDLNKQSKLNWYLSKSTSKYDVRVSNNKIFYNLIDIFLYCSYKEKNGRIMENRIEKAEKLIRSSEALFSHWKTQNKEMVWDRVENDVICIIPNSGTYKKTLFSYNVKNGKKFLANYFINKDKWKFIPASLSSIFREMEVVFRLNTSRYNISKEEEPTPMPQIYLKDLCSLFRGTLLEWAIKNINPDYKIICLNDNNVMSFKELISPNTMDGMSFMVLLDSKDKLSEQLLKSKLYNLFFLRISEKIHTAFHRCNYYSASIFEDIEKDPECCFNVTKGSNLKQMLGFDLNILREVNDLAFIRWGDSDIGYWDDDDHYKMRERQLIPFIRLPCLAQVESVLGISLSSVSKEQRQEIYDIFVSETNLSRRIRYIKDTIVNEYGWAVLATSPAFIEAIHSLSLQKRIKLMKNLTININGFNNINFNTIKDYYNMRKQMETYTENHSIVFDIRNFPIFVKESKRFIARPLTGYKSSKEYFMRYIHENCFYNEDTLIAQDNEGNITGALVRTTPYGNLFILHDKLSKLISVYQNEIDQENLKEAFKRVKCLEFKDANSGLEIVCPQSADDVSREGMVLSHCVGSYLQEIANGQENIVFLRRIDMPTDPYYTIDVVNKGEIRQVHCYRNGNPTAEGQQKAYLDSGLEVYNKTFDIKGFLKKWCKARGLDSTTIKDQYGALVAL